MGIEKIQKQELPDFGLSDIYVGDYWDIQSIDVYKNATEKLQKEWMLRSNQTGKINFAIVKNIVIREELKYCLYTILKTRQIGLATLSFKYDNLKSIFKFVNENSFNSLLDSSLESFSFYTTNVLHKKAVIKNGSRFSLETGERYEVTKCGAHINLYKKCISLLNDFYFPETEKDEFTKDIWKAHNLDILDKNIEYNRTIDFSTISNEEFRQILKEFCKQRLNTITYSSVSFYVHTVKRFYSWLDSIHPEIIHLDMLSRSIMLDYFVWLRTESDMSQSLINTDILQLKVFFEIGNLMELKHFPEYNLIISSDYAVKSKKGKHFLTDDEVKGIISIIPKLPKLYGKITYSLLYLGCRISEVIFMSIDSLKQYEDGHYYLVLNQTKTLKEYEKPISDALAKIIKSEIDKNIRRFGNEAKYVFVSDDNKPISRTNFSQALTKVIVENNIKDRNGEFLHCNSHRFRSTLATNLLKEGYDVKSIGQMLGQKSLASLAYYANVTNKQTKEQLKGRLEKDELLISNIGKFDDKVLADYDNPITLCNGYCVMPSELGVCKKSNHCLDCDLFIPTIAYLTNYEHQLHNVEASIEIAKTNGMDSLLQKQLKTKESLERIIKKIKERRGDNE